MKKSRLNTTSKNVERRKNGVNIMMTRVKRTRNTYLLKWIISIADSILDVLFKWKPFIKWNSQTKPQRAHRQLTSHPDSHLTTEERGLRSFFVSLIPQTTEDKKRPQRHHTAQRWAGGGLSFTPRDMSSISKNQ